MLSNKLIACFIVLMSTCLSSSASASYEIHPYFGADQQVNRTRFKRGYGKEIFPKHHAQLNLYSGLKFDDRISLEFGYLSTVSKSRFVSLGAGDVALGNRIPGHVNSAVFKSYIKLKGYHLGIVNNFSLPEWGNFRVMGGVGVIFLKANAQRNCMVLNTIDGPIVGYAREFKKKKPVIKLMIAPEYIFKNRLGIRASACFLNTSTMRITAAPLETISRKSVSAVNPTIRLKDSLVYSLGLFYEF